jgi:hypothetical protein
MKTLVSAAAVAAIAGSAYGLGETLDRSNYPIYTASTPGITLTALPMSSADRGPLSGQGTSVYGWDDTTPDINGRGFVAAPAGTGILGVEDYGSTLSASGPPNGTPTTQFGTMNAMSYEFVGGVTAIGGILFFDYFFNDFSFGNGFGIQFPSAGNFIWSITFNPTGLIVPTEGYHVITANTNPNIGPVSSGQWFLSEFSADPSGFPGGIGHNDLAWDSGTFDYDGTGASPPVNIGYAFAIGVPTPGAVALMGIAGLAGVSRRRR